MLRIVLSFDDGRYDNYLFAYPILKKYSLQAEINIVTGFLDKSFFDHSCLYKGRFLNINNLKVMSDIFKYASHTDKHFLSLESYNDSVKKLFTWHLIHNKKIGVALPHSDESELNTFLKNVSSVSFVRTGRDKICYSLKYVILYLIYKTTHSKYIYCKFNGLNINNFDKKNKIVKSIVIHRSDSIGQLKYLINKHLNSDGLIVFMFHSIRDDSVNKWCYSIKKFDMFCRFLSKLSNDNKIDVTTLTDLYE